jgi:hypothetical protein
MVKPIKPSEVVALKKETFPDEVFTAFNALIAQNVSGGTARVLQKHAVARMIEEFEKAGKKTNSAEIYTNHWLDIEEVYAKSGWNVEYDKPAYCESYEAAFTFRAKRS